MRSTYHMLMRHSLPRECCTKNAPSCCIRISRSFTCINTKKTLSHTHVYICIYAYSLSTSTVYCCLKMSDKTPSRRICACIDGTTFRTHTRGPTHLPTKVKVKKGRSIQQESDVGLSLHIFIVDESAIQIRINSKINRPEYRG